MLTKIELDKLSVMYDGDRGRDASSKIRGFLFQDYVTIMCLLQDKVECVCSEYLEDVDVFFEDGTFEFIQVKYYPIKSPDRKEISTDLYYQFLRLQILHSSLKIKPRLFIHRNHKVDKPTIQEMKDYVGIGDALPKSVAYLNTRDSGTWLKENVYKTNKKDEQKEKLFATMASEDSIEAFVDAYNISHQLDIINYKEKLMEELAKTYTNTEKGGNEENWKLILLGLANSYIQRRYTLDKPCFDQLRVNKKEFNQYMTESVQMKTEQTIESYLVGIVCEEYGEIINHNDLSLIQTHMLNLIYQKTVQWVNQIGRTAEGQYQLINTFSIDDVSKVNSYKRLPIGDRLLYIAECKQFFLVFLDYLWKIMLNICQEKVKDEQEISAKKELFDPCYYIDRLVTDYICLHFPEDKFAPHSVILPRVGGNFKGATRKIVGRMVNMPQKPEKWFFENSKISRGKNYYDYSTADVNETATVVDLGKDSFYIECMDCIRIDEKEWKDLDMCNECIFSEKCTKEGWKL